MPDLRRLGHLAVGTALTSRAGTRFHLLLDRLSAGRLFGSVRGLRTVVLTTTGRRSGRRVEAPLSALEDAGGWVVAASNGGRDHPPAWLLNLRADPRAELRVNGRRGRLPSVIWTSFQRLPALSSVSVNSSQVHSTTASSGAGCGKLPAMPADLPLLLMIESDERPGLSNRYGACCRSEGYPGGQAGSSSRHYEHLSVHHEVPTAQPTSSLWGAADSVVPVATAGSTAQGIAPNGCSHSSTPGRTPPASRANRCMRGAMRSSTVSGP